MTADHRGILITGAMSLGATRQGAEEYVDFCLKRALPKKEKGSTNKHHILLRTTHRRFARSDWNLVHLSIADHIRAHILLARFTMHPKALCTVAYMFNFGLVEAQQKLTGLTEAEIEEAARLKRRWQESEERSAISTKNMRRLWRTKRFRRARRNFLKDNRQHNWCAMGGHTAKHVRSGIHKVTCIFCWQSFWTDVASANVTAGNVVEFFKKYFPTTQWARWTPLAKAEYWRGLNASMGVYESAGRKYRGRGFCTRPAQVGNVLLPAVQNRLTSLESRRHRKVQQKIMLARYGGDWDAVAWLSDLNQWLSNIGLKTRAEN